MNAVQRIVARVFGIKTTVLFSVIDKDVLHVPDGFDVSLKVKNGIDHPRLVVRGYGDVVAIDGLIGSLYVDDGYLGQMRPGKR